MFQETKLRVKEAAGEVMHYFICGTKPEDSRETIVIRRSIEICKAISAQPRTAYELAESLDLSPQNVFQYLGGLEAGGLPIKRIPGPVEDRTGRPETMFST